MRLRVAAVSALTVVCLVWVLWGVDLDAALAGLTRFRWSFIAPIWGLYLLAHLMRAQRFRILLPSPIDYRASFSALSIGYLALHVFPFRLGELVRPYLVREQRGVAFGDSLAVVVVERILDVVMLLLMILGTSWFVPLATQVEVGGVDILALAQRAAGTVAAAGTAGLLAMMLAGPRLLSLADHLPGGARLRPLLERFRAALVALSARPAAAAQAVILSALIWIVTLFAVQVQLVASPGVPTDFGAALATWTATLSGMAVLPTPGFFGGFEAACSTALQLLGATPEAAAPFAILLHLTQFAFTIVLGTVFLAIEGLGLREVVAQSRAGR
ncbi:MAG: flippase-like domain-containing protein [Myxococcales bacterium]|nr:flippase-like domain-containing protein [Myxococcales bacterium]